MTEAGCVLCGEPPGSKTQNPRILAVLTVWCAGAVRRGREARLAARSEDAANWLVFEDSSDLFRLGQGAGTVSRRLDGNGPECAQVPIEAASAVLCEDSIDFGESGLSGSSHCLDRGCPIRSAAGSSAPLMG